MSKPFRLFSFLLLICVICFSSVTSAFADGENDKGKNEIDISISPEDVLFNIGNMKPGDWAPRTITVKNSGSKDFAYKMQLQNTGEKKLFNELLLEIIADDKELYQGKVAEFKSMPARKLISGNEENLDITIRFPEHLGNDFQGLTSEFVLIFTVEGSDNPGGGGGDNPGDGGGDNPGGGGGDNPGDGGGDNPGGGGGDNPGDGGGDNPGDGEGDNPGDGEEDNTWFGEEDKPEAGKIDNPGEKGIDNPLVFVSDNPTVPTGQTDSGGPTTAGFRLPDTSTNIFNLLLFGSVLVAGGIVLIIIRHYRRMKMSQ